MTEFEETSKKIQDLVDEVFQQGIGVGYNHGLEVGTQNGYKRGYENGKKAGKDIQNWNEVVTKAEEYQRGLDDAWECARKIYNMTAEKTIRVFGGCSNWVNYSASEAIAKVREYKQDKPKQDKDYHEEAWWQNLGYDIEQMADDWGCTIECIAERANQLWEEKGESE